MYPLVANLVQGVSDFCHRFITFISYTELLRAEYIKNHPASRPDPVFHPDDIADTFVPVNEKSRDTEYACPGKYFPNQYIHHSPGRYTISPTVSIALRDCAKAGVITILLLSAS
jgi:hypothetical protein